MVSVPQVGRSLVIASGASEIAAAEMPGLWPMTMRCPTRGPTPRIGVENVVAFGEIQRIVGLQQPRGHSQHLGESLGGFARTCGGAREDEIRNQAAFLETPRHLQRLVLALAAQRTLEVAHVGILLRIGVPDQREPLAPC